MENGGSRWKYRLITGEMLARRFRDRLPRWQRLLPFRAMTYYRPWITTSRSIYRWPAVNPIYESIYAPTVILEPCQFSYSKITLPYPSWPRYVSSNNYYLKDCSRVLSMDQEIVKEFFWRFIFHFARVDGSRMIKRIMHNEESSNFFENFDSNKIVCSIDEDLE